MHDNIASRPWEERSPGSWRATWEIPGVGPATTTVDANSGARIGSFAVNGIELLGHSSSKNTAAAFRSGCFVMAPYAGRVAGVFNWMGANYRLPISAPPHAARGLVADVPWIGDRTGTYRCALDDRLPFGGWVTQPVRCDQRGLTVHVSVGNDERAMPVNVGLHPWFRRRIAKDQVRLDLDIDRSTSADGERSTLQERLLLSSEARPSSTCVVATAEQPVLRWGDRLALTLDSNAAFWVVYDGDAGGLCVEPQTAPPNALRAGDFTVASPGKPVTLSLYTRPSWELRPR